MRTDPLTVGSLFSGIGGFDLGFEAAGMEIRWQVEIDERCQEILRKRHPNIKRFGDIRDVGRHNLEAVDVICGGFPCQDLSVAGKRAGLAGERSGLWFEFARVIDEREPSWIVLENVPGLLSSNGGKDFAIVIGGLTGVIPEVPSGGWKNAGFAWGPRYKIAWRVLDAQYFGVAQRRRRVFIVGHLGDGRAAQVLFESEGLWGNPPARRTKREGVTADVAGSLGSHRTGRWGNDLDNNGAFITGAVSSKWAKGTGGPSGDEVQNLAASPITTRSEGCDASEDGTGRGTPLVVGALHSGHPSRDASDVVNGHLLAFSSKDNGRDAEIDMSPALRSMNCDGSHENGGGQVAVAFTERTRKDGRNLECQKDVAYALTNPGSGGRTHSRNLMQGMAVRRLTPLECERLQGFPDYWTACVHIPPSQKYIEECAKKGEVTPEYVILQVSDSTRYRQIGNAVAVPVIEWIGRAIVEAARD